MKYYRWGKYLYATQAFLYYMAHPPLSQPLIRQINYFDRFCRVRNVYYIHICSDCRHSLGEHPEIQRERQECERDEKTKKRTKTQTAWFCWPHKNLIPFSLRAVWCTGKLNIAYSLRVISYIFENHCLDPRWIKDVLIVHRPAQTACW